VLGTGDTSSDEDENSFAAKSNASNGMLATIPSLLTAARPLLFAPPMFQFRSVFENGSTSGEQPALQQTTSAVATLPVCDRSHVYDIDPDL
jgi:hypothetical protein